MYSYRGTSLIRKHPRGTSRIRKHPEGYLAHKKTPRRYLPYVMNHGPGDSAGGFITFLLLLNNFIPISLYVSMEIAKTVQGLQVPARICNKSIMIIHMIYIYDQHSAGPPI